MENTFDAAGLLNAPPIVLIHGSVVTRKMWLPQLRGLSDAYRVIAPDLPGHGALAHIPFSFSASVETLADLIRSEANGHALLTGLSLGGYVAMEMASRHPELAAGLVLSGCSLNFEGLVGAYVRLVSGLMRRGWLKQSRAQAEEKTRRMFPPEMADVCEAQMQAGVYPDVLGPIFAEMAGKDYTQLLAGYSGDGLILNGENDKSSRKNEAKFAAALTRGRLQVVPGAGHACNIDQPEAFNRAVRGFAREIGWGR